MHGPLRMEASTAAEVVLRVFHVVDFFYSLRLTGALPLHAFLPLEPNTPNQSDVNSVHGNRTKEARMWPALTAQPAKWALRHKKGPLI